MTTHTPNQNVLEIAQQMWALERHYTPLFAVLAGVDMPDAIVFREAPAEYDARIVEAKALLEKADALVLADLSVQERATLDLAKRELSLIVELYDVDAHLRPSLFPVGPDFNTVFLANAAALTTRGAAQLYLDRLRTYPAFLDDLTACLTAGIEKGYRYPKVVTERAAAGVRGHIAGEAQALAWYAPFARSPIATSIADLAEEAAAFITDVLKPRFEAYARFIEGPLSEAGRDSISSADDLNGEAYYSVLTRRFTSLNDSPADIHTLGLEEVERLTQALGAAAAASEQDVDLDAMRKRLKTDSTVFAPDAETLLAELQILAKKIDAKIPMYFGQIPRTTYGINQMSLDQSTRMPPAYAQPANLKDGQAGLFWVSAQPEKLPRYMHVPLVLHEAWPGHLMHLALVEEQGDLPDFRRYGAVKYTACVEGWAQYCETLGLDMGFYSSPEDEFGRLDMEMWRAVRLVVDTGLHLHSWSRSKAIDYMAQHLSLPMETIEAEVDRYIGMPGQALAYQVGAIAVRQLRKDMEAALGDEFDIRAYHDAVTGAGAVTLPILKDIVSAKLGQSSAH